MDRRSTDEYLARIGAARPLRADAAALRTLHLRHLHSVPFENLSIHLDEPIELGEEALLEKLVSRRRGGFCYELNGAFAALLNALGFEVTLLAARVIGDGRPGPPLDHLVVRVVGAEGETWLADVGFGRFSHVPLRWGDTAEQRNDGGAFTMTEAAHGDLDVYHDGEPAYRIESHPRVMEDFEPLCWWQQTSPKSHFTQSLTCTILTETGRVTLSGRRLIHTSGGDREEKTLEDDAGVLAAYRTHFGITLDRVPRISQRSTRVKAAR